MEKIDLVQLLLQLIEPQQSRSLQFHDLLGLIALVDLLGILNCIQPQASQEQGNRPLQEALQAILQSQQAGSGKGDLLGLLTKNPAMLKNLFNMLNTTEEEEREVNKTNLNEEPRLKSKRV